MPKKKTLRFTPEATERLAKSVGYTGRTDGSPAAIKEYGEFLQKNPKAGKLMNHYKTQAVQMAKGGMVKTRKNYQTGGLAAPQVTGVGTPQYLPPQTAAGRSIQDESTRRIFQPSTPFGGTVTPVGTQLQAQQDVDPLSGQVAGDRAAGAVLAQSSQAARRIWRRGAMRIKNLKLSMEKDLKDNYRKDMSGMGLRVKLRVQMEKFIVAHLLVLAGDHQVRFRV